MRLECPLVSVPPAAWEILDAAECMDQGLLPVAGGLEDQAAAFLTAARFVRAETKRWQEARKK
jgi:hypothetical protein